MKKKIITYGTFDLFHIGHLNLIRSLKSMGDELIVAVSTDEFNGKKGKNTIINYNDRAEIVRSLKYVDMVIPETSWEQKIEDIRNYEISTFAIGDDWRGQFDYLSEYCEVLYLPRTEGISTTKIKSEFGFLNQEDIKNLKKSIDFVATILDKLR